MREGRVVGCVGSGGLEGGGAAGSVVVGVGAGDCDCGGWLERFAFVFVWVEWAASQGVERRVGSLMGKNSGFFQEMVLLMEIQSRALLRGRGGYLRYWRRW